LEKIQHFLGAAEFKQHIDMNLKKCLIFFLSISLLGFSNRALASRPSSDIKVLIDIPEGCGLTGSPVFLRTLRTSDVFPHFYVILENVSSKAVFLIRTNKIFI
jgi:hypothetical protein